MGRSFTEQERENIKQKLMTACENNWGKYGYRRTSVDELCAQVSISKGTFYSIYEFKEDLFCDTLCFIQKRLYAFADEMMENEPNKYGLAQALKLIYREYDKNNFIYNMQSADFVALTNKLTKEQLQQLDRYGQQSGNLFFDKPYLKFRIEKEKAISVLTALLANISVKDKLVYDHLEVFDFMLDNLIDKIFE